MKDFNLAKYLKEHNLGSHGILGNYVDLQALKEEVGDTRMMDLGGDQIEQGIISLLDDGFEPEDVLDACKMFINAHVNAAMQGKKF